MGVQVRASDGPSWVVPGGHVRVRTWDVKTLLLLCGVYLVGGMAFGLFLTFAVGRALGIGRSAANVIRAAAAFFLMMLFAFIVTPLLRGGR
ncbi:MAG: hypothetical protein AB1563_12455 [Bacillota bacterium]